MSDENRYQSEDPYVMLFPHLVEPAEGKDQAGRPTGKKAYSADFVMSPDSEDFMALRKRVIELVKEHFPAKYALAVKAAGAKPTYAGVLDAMIAGIINTPFRRGDDNADKRAAVGKDDAEWQRGKYVFKASKPEKKLDGGLLHPPALGGVVNGKAMDFKTPESRVMHAGKFFFGAEAYFQVSLATYTAGTGGVKAYLEQVFVNGKGEPMASGASPSETFGKHVGRAEDYDPTTGEMAELLS